MRMSDGRGRSGFGRPGWVLWLGLWILLTGLAGAQRVWFGTTGEEPARGIYTAVFDPQKGTLSTPVLAAEVPRPGFLTCTADGKFLYSTSLIEADDGAAPTGAVASFAIDGGQLRELGRRESGGRNPCFVALDARGTMLMVAHYSAGSVASFPIGSDGMLGPRASLIRHRGASVHPTRQTGPHAHAIYPGPDGRFAYVPDLGIDQVVRYALDPEAATLTPAGAARTRPGAGPRHLKFGRDGKQAYVLGELDLTVTVYDRDVATGELRRKEVVEVLPPGADAAEMTCSEILVSPGGRYVYTAQRDVAGRGRDSLTVLAVGAEGRLSRRQTVGAEAWIPRHIQLSPDGRWLLVAGRRGGGIPIFEVAAEGTLAFTGQRADVPGAMCILFAR